LTALISNERNNLSEFGHNIFFSYKKKSENEGMKTLLSCFEQMTKIT